MAKDHRQPRRRRGLDRKQKAQIAVAVITTLPQLIWAIAFLLSTLMGSKDHPGNRGVEQLQLFGSPHYATLPRFGRPHNDQQRRFVASTRITSWRLRQDSNLQPRD